MKDRLYMNLLFCLLVVGEVSRTILGQEVDQCKKYFNFESANSTSVLEGSWITLGSTRRVFSCNQFLGFDNGGQGLSLDESWMVPGFLGLWTHEVMSEVSEGLKTLNVDSAGFDGLLMPGRLAVGVYGNSLLLVQCNSILWFPTVAYTVLSRDMPLNPQAEVEDIFTKFRTPTNIPSFYMVNHEGCDEAQAQAAAEAEGNGINFKRSVEGSFVSSDLPLRSWDIQKPRDVINF